MDTIDTQRIYATHEAGYWPAQRHGFAIIRKLEAALRERNGWAGRYAGRWDHALEEIVVDDDCSDEFDAAHTHAEQIALEASKGHARQIIAGLGRTDEAALMILAANPLPG